MTNLMKMIFMMIRQMDAPRSGFFNYYTNHTEWDLAVIRQLVRLLMRNFVSLLDPLNY